jgi:tetratricopeptide (TPR) repeat protein
VMATLSKPTAVVLPAIVVVLNLWVLRRPPRQFWRGVLLWAVLALPCIIVTQFVQGAADTEAVALWRRPLVAADALAFYLYKLVWPASLGLDYGRRPEWIFQHAFAWWTWLVPVALAMFLWVFRRRVPLLVAAAMIFVLGLLPVLGLIRFDFQRFSTVSDHYLYLSMFGVALAAAWGVSRLRRPRLAAIAIAVLVAAWGLRSWHQTWVWQNSETLFTHAIEVNPASAAAYSSLADLARHRGMNPQAEAFAREAVRLRPDLAPAWITLGALFEQEGRLDEAIAAARGACAAEPDVAEGFTNLSLLLARKGQLPQAEAMARRAVELEPDDAKAHINLGLLEAQGGHLDMGVRDMQAAVNLEPNDVLAQANLGALLARQGRRDEAISHFQAALRIDPDYPIARRGLAHLTGGDVAH